MQFLFEKINYVLGLNSYMTFIVSAASAILVILASFLVGKYGTAPKVFGYVFGVIGIILGISVVFGETYVLIKTLGTETLDFFLFLAIIKELSFVVLYVCLLLWLVFKRTKIGTVTSIIMAVALIIYLFLTVITILIDKNVIKIEAVKILLGLIK